MALSQLQSVEEAGGERREGAEGVGEEEEGQEGLNVLYLIYTELDDLV